MLIEFCNDDDDDDDDLGIVDLGMCCIWAGWINQSRKNLFILSSSNWIIQINAVSNHFKSASNQSSRQCKNSPFYHFPTEQFKSVQFNVKYVLGCKAVCFWHLKDFRRTASKSNSLIPGLAKAAPFLIAWWWLKLWARKVLS